MEFREQIRTLRITFWMIHLALQAEVGTYHDGRGTDGGEKSKFCYNEEDNYYHEGGNHYQGGDNYYPDPFDFLGASLTSSIFVACISLKSSIWNFEPP